MFIEKMEQKRIEQRLSQKELAQKAGIAYGTYRNFMDTHKLSFFNFISLVQVLGMYNELKTLVEINQKKSIQDMKKENQPLPKRVRKAK
jgi:transcriptional regulator with XRE-family HTH domain